MNSRFMLAFASLSGFIYVSLGAFTAHALEKSLGQEEIDWLKTGLQYQAVHTLALMVLSVAMYQRASLWYYWSALFLAMGIVLFSGSLYCLALSHLKIWVYITPLGGVSFLTGWVLTFFGALRHFHKGRHCG